MADPSSTATATPLPDDVIEVRPDERFDEAKLADYLRDKLPGADAPLRVTQFGGGHANLTYLLQFGGTGGDDGDRATEYVLRRPPLGPVAKGAHDMHREYRALSKLWRAFPLAPRAFHYTDDASVIGAEFVIMERRGGVVIRSEIPEVFGGGRDAAANRKISEVLIDTLAQLHEVEPAAVELEGLGKPDGFLERQVTGWSKRHDAAKVGDVPLADEVARWLVANLPESPKPTLVHNDWKLDNIAIAEDDPGRCEAVYDWDMCSVGDPLCDLGTLLCSWGDPDSPALVAAAMPTDSPGFMRRDEAIARYCARLGLTPEQVRYYHVFGVFKMAVVIEQIYVRYHRGQTKDERFANMHVIAHGLHEQAAALRP